MPSDTVVIGQARKEELEALFRKNGGTLTPSQVVEFATNPKTALHSAFPWDDEEAAELYRIHLARTLIRHTFVVLEVPGSLEERRVRMALSLPADRGNVGYRLTSQALGDPEMRDQMLRSAMAELQSFRKKFTELQELAQVFAAIDAALEKQPRARKGKRAS